MATDNKKKGYLESYKLTVQVFLVAGTGITTAAITLMRLAEFSAWLVLSIFGSLVCILLVFYFLIKCFEVSEEMED